jgi:hypothetical protein
MCVRFTLCRTSIAETNATVWITNIEVNGKCGESNQSLLCTLSNFIFLHNIFLSYRYGTIKHSKWNNIKIFMVLTLDHKLIVD